MTLSWTLLVLTQGRIGLIASLLILGIGTVTLISRRSTRWAIGTGVAMLIAAVAVVMTQPRMAFKKIKYEPRAVIWDYSWRMVQQQPIVGYGMSSLSEVYVEKAYQDPVMYTRFVHPVLENNPEFAVQGKTMVTHHPHNAFLLYWLAVGIGGALLLLALLGFATTLPAGEDRIFLWLFLLALFLQCMTEPVGGHLLPEFIALMLFVWEKTCNPDTPAHIA
jgi:O-antigen ligase